MVRRRTFLMLWVLWPLACGQAASGQVASMPAGPGRHLKIDLARRQVILAAAVSVRHEPLEFFLCTQGTKDYESMLVTRVQPSALHAALLALGLMPGKPGQWRTDKGGQPKFAPPAGAELTITLRWKDARGVAKEARAADWLVNPGTKKRPKALSWVFVGSGILDNGRYWADVDGHHISVANFASSVIDVPFKSTDKNELLEFAPNPKVVPPKGTPVSVVLTAAKGAETAPSARVTFMIDRLGQIALDGRVIDPEDIGRDVKKFLARHAQGAAEVIVDPRAMVFDRDRLKRILEDAGMKEVSFRTGELVAEVLPRTPPEARRALGWWRKQFANAGQEIIDPAEDAAAVLKHLRRREKELRTLLELWADYTAGLRRALTEHRSATRPAKDKVTDTP